MDARRLKDKLFTLLVYAGGLLALAPLAAILASLVAEGAPVLLARGLEFLTSPAPAGIGPALYGTLVMSILAVCIATPLALAAALFLYEFPGSRLAPTARVILQSLVEIPTILTGLFIYSLLVAPPPPLLELYRSLHLPIPYGRYSGLAGALALALIILPYIAVQAENILRQVPSIYREAALALGATRQRAAAIIATMALRGLATALLIGFAKAVGETAPLLFTAGGGYTAYPPTPLDALTSPIGAVSLLIYDYARMPTPETLRVAWGAALVLTCITMALILAARLVVAGRLGRRT